jgi:hypothetical protein
MEYMIATFSPSQGNGSNALVWLLVIKVSITRCTPRSPGRQHST